MKPSLRSHIIPVLVALSLLFSMNPPARAQNVPAQAAACEEGTQTSGALYRICTPIFASSNQLIIYVQGYTAINEPVALPPTEVDGVGNLEQAAGLLGYALAMSSFITNGLNVESAIPDLVDLVEIYKQSHGQPTSILLLGVSQGALTGTLALERHPETFSGALSMCGPYGNFQDQVNYLGDFRVVFDTFFPGLTPGTAVEIPPPALDTWESTIYSTTVKPVVSDPANAAKVDQLLAVTQAPFDSANAESKEQTIERLLWYSVYATNDAQSKLAGQPFENQSRQYTGSNDDTALNQNVLRYSADITATKAISNYETTGLITRPIVTLHTTGDPVVPYWHADLYLQKTNQADNPNLHEHRQVVGYGHCKFSQNDVLSAFGRLAAMVANPPAPPMSYVYLPLVNR